MGKGSVGCKECRPWTATPQDKSSPLRAGFPALWVTKGNRNKKLSCQSPWGKARLLLGSVGRLCSCLGPVGVRLGPVAQPSASLFPCLSLGSLSLQHAGKYSVSWPQLGDERTRAQSQGSLQRQGERGAIRVATASLVALSSLPDGKT